MSDEYSFNFAVDPATKLDNLNAARDAKLEQWKPAILQSMPDADSPQIVGVTGGIGSGIDQTTKRKYSLLNQPTEDRATGFDAYEVAHPNDPYQNSLSGITKYERQRQRLAEDIKKDPSLVGKLGIKDVNNITNDDIVRAGTREQLVSLYNLMPGPKAAWEPGPMDGINANTPIELGSKENPLNIPVERNFTGKYDNFGRPLADIRNKDTDKSVMESLGYSGNEDTGFSPLEAAIKLKKENKLTPEVAEYLAGKADRMNAIPSAEESFAEAARGNIVERAANTAKAVGSGVLGAGYDLMDLGAELFGKDLGSDEEKTKAVNEITGYNPYYTTKAGQDVKSEITKMVDNGVTAEGAYNVLSTGFSNPEFLGESIGFLLPMLVGGVATAGGKGVAAATKGLAAAKKTGDVAKIEEATVALAKAKNEYTSLGAAADFVSKNAGLLGVSAGETSDSLDKYAENAGIAKADIDASKVVGTYLATVVKNGIDRWADVGILKDPNIASGLVNVLKGASEKQVGEIGSALGKVAGGIALSGGKEAGTEYIQTFIEQVNEQVGEQAGKTLADAWNNSENELDRLTGAALGFTGAQQMNVTSVPLAVGNTVTELSSTAGLLVDKVNPKSSASTAKEPEYELNDMEVEELYNIADEVFAKHDAKEGTVADRIKSLRELEEKAYRISDNNENKKLLLEAITGVKSDISKEIEGLEDVQEYSKLLGSKESFLDTLDDVMEANGYKVEGKLEENLRAIAQTFGITDETFQKIKKDYETVDVEATKSSKGYLTQGKALRSILDTVNPDTEKATKLVDQMKRYESSQAKWLKTYDKAKAELEAEVASYNTSVKKGLADFDKKPTQKVAKVSANSKIAINVEQLEDGTYIVNEGGYAQVYEAKKKNIEGIRNEFNKSKEFFKKAGLVQETTGVQTKPIIDTEVSSGKLKKAVAQVKKDFDKHGVTAIISTKNDDGRNKLIVSGNEQITNKGKYTKDDIVSVLVGNITMQKDFDAFLKEARNKNSKLRKEISAAQEAGATIVIDTGLAKYPSKKPKTFDYVDTAGATTKKSVREVLVNQLTSFGPVKYESELGSRVFKSKEDMAKVKAENKDKADKAKTKEEALTAKVKEYSTTGNISYDEKMQEYFKSEDKLEAYLNNRLDREATEYADLFIKVEEEMVQKNNLEESAKAIVSADEADTVNTKIKDLNTSIKSKVVRLKELSYVKGRANDLIKDMAKKKAATKDFLTRYKAAKAVSEEAAQELIMNESEEGLVKDILEQSYTKGAENFTVNGITYVPDLRNVVNTGNTVLDIVEVVDMFDSAVTKEGKEISSDKYISRARTFISKTITKYTKDGKVDDRITMKDSPAYGLLFDAKGDVNDTVILALKLAMDEYVSYKGSTLSPIHKSKEDVAQMLGVLESQVGKNQYELLKDKGMFKKTVDNEVGKAVLKKLGLSKKKSVEDEVYARLAAELGQIAGLIAEYDGVIEYTEVETSEYQNAITQDSGEKFPPSKGSIKFMRFTKTVKGKLNSKVIDSVKDIYEAVHNVISEEEAFRKEPSRRFIPKAKRRHVREQVAKDTVGAKIPTGKQIGVSSTEAINNLINVEYEYNSELIDELKAMDKDVLLSMLGYKTEDELDMLSFNDRDAQISTNRDILKNLDELLALDTTDKDNKMYFDWFFSSNGRYMMDSNTINPQTEKQLHRWLVTPTKHKKEYTVNKGVFKSEGKDVTDVVHYAIAQSMGFGVDKKSTNKINDFAKALLGLSKKELAEVREAILVKGKSEYKFGEHTIEVEHLGHFMQGLKFLENAKKGKFESNLSAEFDAVTSGFGLKLLQLPILRGMDKSRLQGIVNGEGKLGTVWYWLNKVGVFKPEQLGAYNSMNDVLDSKGFYAEGANFYDSYQSLAVDAKIDYTELNPENTIYKRGGKLLNVGAIYKGVESALPSLNADETVGKLLRNLFKDPFMTFNYSAGIKSIRASLSNKMVNDLVAGIVSEKPEYADATKFLAKYTGVGATTLVQRLRAEPLRNIPAGKNGNLEDVLLKTMDISYGSKVQEIMEKNFKPFMDAHKEINSAFKSMFEVFNYKYKAELAKVPAGELTSDKKLEIIDKLRESFPVIKGPLSANLDEGIHLYRSESVTPNAKDQRQTPAQTYLKGRDVKSMKTRHMIREFEAAISAGSVVPIHYIDGTVMGQLLGKGSAITAIHDAIIPPLTEAKDTIKKYNESMIKVAKEYSIVGAINDMLNRIELTPEQVKELNEIKTTVPVVGEDGKTTYESVGVANNFNAVKSRFAKLNTNVHEARTELFTDIDKGVTVGHMAGLPGSMWSNKETAVAAGGDLYTQKEFGVSGETIMEIDAANSKFLNDNLNIKVVEGDTFLYLNNTITLDKDATFEDRVVYLAHEIVHAKTKEWLEDNRHTSMVRELTKNIDTVLAKLESKPRKELTDGEIMLRSRLLHDNGQEELRLLENVAVLAAEPAMRAELNKLLPTERVGIIAKILDRIKTWLGKELPIDAAKILKLVDGIVIKAEAYSKDAILSKTALDAIPDEGC